MGCLGDHDRLPADRPAGHTRQNCRASPGPSGVAAGAEGQVVPQQWFAHTTAPGVPRATDDASTLSFTEPAPPAARCVAMRHWWLPPHKDGSLASMHCGGAFARRRASRAQPTPSSQGAARKGWWGISQIFPAVADAFHFAGPVVQTLCLCAVGRHPCKEPRQQQHIQNIGPSLSMVSMRVVSVQVFKPDRGADLIVAGKKWTSRRMQPKHATTPGVTKHFQQHEATNFSSPHEPAWPHVPHICRGWENSFYSAPFCICPHESVVATRRS